MQAVGLDEMRQHLRAGGRHSEDRRPQVGDLFALLLRRLFQNRVAIGSAKPERTDRGEPRAGYIGPSRNRLRNLKSRAIQADLWIQGCKVQIGGHFAGFDREHGLNQSANSSGRFQMPNVRLHCA